MALLFFGKAKGTFYYPEYLMDVPFNLIIECPLYLQFLEAAIRKSFHEQHNGAVLDI